MNSGNFPILAAGALVALVISVPVISLVFLKRERDARSDASHRKSLASLFTREILLWLAGLLVFGTLLVMLLGMFIYVNAHAGATGSEPVPVTPVILMLGILAGLSLYGVWLHTHMVARLLRSLPTC